MTTDTAMLSSNVPAKNKIRSVKGGVTSMADKGKWIQQATDKMKAKGTVGSLRSAAGVSGDKTISSSKLTAMGKKAKSMGGERGAALSKKVNFAKNIRK